MSTPPYATPETAEAAFYAAFRALDWEAMRQAWATTDDIACIHPGGPRLTGAVRVLTSWRQILSGGVRPTLELGNAIWIKEERLACSMLDEYLTPPGDPRSRAVVATTNVYRLTSHGWRMILRHASPLQEIKPQPPASRKVLH